MVKLKLAQYKTSKRDSALTDSLPRVLIILNRYRPMIGGAERQCEMLCSQLVSRVRWIGILTHRYAPELKATELIDGIAVERLGRPLSRSRGIPIAFYLELAYQLLKKRKKFDLVHCHTAGLTGLLVASICRFLRKPVLLKLTAEGELRQQVAPSSVDERSTLSFLKTFIRGILSYISIASPKTYVIALSQGGRDEAHACGVAQVHVIPNGVDTQKYSKSFKNKGEKLDFIRFGYAGRLSAEKGTHLLVNAFATLLGMHSNIRLSIAGTGDKQLQSSEENIRTLQKSWPLAVEHVGVVSDSVAFLSNLDVYISASNYEGLPNAVLEALAVGLPCILSNIEAHREILRLNPNATVSFFEPNDLNSLISAVNKTLANWPSTPSVLSPELEIRNIANVYLDLYRKIIAECHE